MRAARFFLLGLIILSGSIANASMASDLGLEFAYRDSTDTSLVTLQGSRSSSNLRELCGPTGNRCTCIFHSGEKSYRSDTPIGFSHYTNSLSCRIPSLADPSDITHGQLEIGRSLGAKFEISTSITLRQIIGDLPESKVRGLFRYSCERTFFEGEGVSATQVACPAGQRLGLIHAKYNYYLYNSQDGGNMAEKGKGSPFRDPICERQFTKLNCDEAADLRWGLYAEWAGPFQVAITMTSKPEGENATSIYGFAALPDSAGNCPAGLVKIRPWMAQPRSIVQGDIDGSNPPSSFINMWNNLNDTVVEVSQPHPFQVFRQANSMRCEGQHNQPAPRPAPGSCKEARFGAPQKVQSVSYMQLTPVVCGIPKELLKGLF